jgi:hypothetical protein
MQLSTLPSIPSAQPVAAYLPPEPGGGSASLPGNGGTAFAQLLPSPAAGSKPSAPPDKKTEASKTPADETPVPFYYSWLAQVPPQNVPTAAENPKTQAPAGVAAAEGKLLPGTVNLPPGVTKSPVATGENNSVPMPVNGKGCGATAATQPPAPSVSPGRTPVAAGPAVPAPAAPQIAATIPGKASAPTPISGAGVSALATSQAPDMPEKTGAPGIPGTQDAAAILTPGAHLRAAGLGGAEKIAGQGTNAGAAPASIAKASDKKILNSDGKQVTDPSASVGIAVAKVAPAMPTSAQTDRLPPAVMASAPVSTVSAFSNAGQGETQGAVSQQGVAQRAVDAAISAAESLNTGSNQAVNMQFSVGNADLSLRVEMRNGEIHTTFRTDSADLRLDLAHEWQSSNPGSGSGSVRLAEPVFTSSNSQASMAAGENASQQRGGQRPSDSPQPAFAASGSGAGISPSPVEADTSSRPPAILSTSIHLQAFA